MSPLAYIGQEDFAAGILRSSARGMEPGVGVYNAINGLFDDDGDCYVRGGTERAALTALPKGVTSLWQGTLNGETVILASTPDQYFRTNNPVGGAWTALNAGPSKGWDSIVKPVAVGGDVYWPNGAWFQTTPSYPGTINGANVTGGGAGSWWPTVLAGGADIGLRYVCACANRLIVGSGRIVRFSSFDATGKPTPRVFAATDYHELPEGVEIRGLAAIRDTVLIFTSGGIWTITNLALDLTDDYGNPQQTLSKDFPDLSAVDHNTITEYEGRLIVPCADHVYLIDPASSPVAITNSIAADYQTDAREKRFGAGWTWHNHYFLPVVVFDGGSGNWLGSYVRVCRLNRPVRGRMTYYPWTTFEGEAGRVVVGNAAVSPLAATGTGWLLSFGLIFREEVAWVHDSDGVAPVFEIETNDFPTGNGQPNHVRELRAYYTMRAGDDPETGDPLPQPTIEASMAFGDTTAWTALPEVGPPSPGMDPIKWPLHQAKRARYVRARVRCDDAVERLTIHRVQIGIRPATHQR